MFGSGKIVAFLIVVVLAAVSTPANTRPIITISAHGDSLTSCNGVTPNQGFAFLSYREHLWKDHLVPWAAASSHHINNNETVSQDDRVSKQSPPTRTRISFVGRKRGCNRILDARFNRSHSFPNLHDSYFGRSAEKMLAEWHEFVLSPPTSSPDAVVGDIALLLIGTNDFLLHGKANATAVAHTIGNITELMLQAASHHRGHAARRPRILIGLPPDLDLSRVKLSSKRAARWKLYLVSLHAALQSLVSRESGYERYCRGVHEEEAEEGRDNRRSQCELVMFSPGWDPVLHTYDGIHPNHDGEKWMARCWANALLPHLTEARSISNQPDDKSRSGHRLQISEASTQHRELPHHGDDVTARGAPAANRESPATTVTAAPPLRANDNNSISLTAWAALVMSLFVLFRRTCTRTTRSHK
ncbi:Hypothetical protein, putative [Bodo saltans]|uniref:Uncharacterized protein n=1 Tax=Bodo saltans TaxID=75058 RepID=A0A0S4J7G2_BODSA|nr:Hypothetical protein, putative [Bodo saltans]|eukprot:CUG86006.1 Hypothetical protein, putative [Bodo saltans]